MDRPALAAIAADLRALAGRQTGWELRRELHALCDRVEAAQMETLAAHAPSLCLSESETDDVMAMVFGMPRRVAPAPHGLGIVAPLGQRQAVPAGVRR